MASRWLRVDKTLFLAATGLLALGLLMVYSASFPDSQQTWGHDLHYVLRQAVFVTVGMIVLLAGLLIDYRAYRNPLVIGIAVAGVVGLLVLVLTLPPTAGARRWIDLGPFNLQPSEIAKLVIVGFLAFYLSRKDERINDFWFGLMPAISVAGFIVLLIAIEPDLGTAVVISGIVAVMLWVAGLSWRYLLRFSGAVLVLGVAEIARNGYQLRRISAFLNPWADPGDTGFQTVQSLIAVGMGGWTGVGLAAGKQKLFFLPAPYTDFIYAVVAEELGLVGATAVVLAFVVILWRGVRAALRAPDPFGFYLGTGLTAALFLQALVNLSVVVNLIPTTGIPLPLVSYGGSSLIVSCAAIGILLNISQNG